jgi:hypothetical protein
MAEIRHFRTSVEQKNGGMSSIRKEGRKLYSARS